MQCLQCTDHFSVLRIIIRISDSLPRLVRNPAPDQLRRWLLNQMPRASNYQLSGALLQSTRQLVHEEEREKGAGEEEAARKERRKRRQLQQNDGQAVQHYQRSAAWPHTECVENHIVRAKYKQHRVRSSESYLLARASTQPRGSEDQSACQSQRTVFNRQTFREQTHCLWQGRPLRPQCPSSPLLEEFDWLSYLANHAAAQTIFESSGSQSGSKRLRNHASCRNHGLKHFHAGCRNHGLKSLARCSFERRLLQRTMV